ncbi:MAG: ankyrin repeat domain-containing protein [Bacteroidota bacterium]
MKNLVLFLLFSGLLFSCRYYKRNKQADKSKLPGNDYRLFQGTPAWELAKAVQDKNIGKINRAAAKEPGLVNFREPVFGNTLLILSIENQQYKSFKALLDNHADVNIHNYYDGTSAIIEACSFDLNRIKFVKTLLKYGADVNDVETGPRQKYNSTRETPLIKASMAGRLNVVKLLTDSGANINYQNEYGQTALSEALIQWNYDVVIYLLNKGADYRLPLFYRPEVDKKVFIPEFLRERMYTIGSQEHKQKMEIVSFLRSKGIEYKDEPIPVYIVKKIMTEHPDDWKEYLENY